MQDAVTFPRAVEIFRFRPEHVDRIFIIGIVYLLRNFADDRQLSIEVSARTIYEERAFSEVQAAHCSLHESITSVRLIFKLLILLN